jgi:hypothetical protein
MKITICGSMIFAKEMLEAQKQLEKLGHEVLIPIDTHACLENPSLQEDLEHCQTFSDIDVDLDHFQKVSESDAIIVLNYPKNNLSGYIGGATLMEIGIARHYGKRIFILNNLPSEDDLRYVLEIKLAKPTILNGDLNKII